MDTATLEPGAGLRVPPGYQVREILGEGATGRVYRARQARLDRDVVLKILRAGLAPGPDWARRFAEEARLLARVVHPRVAHILDFGSEGDHAWLAMEYLPGETLAAVLARDPRLDLGRVREILDQILEGLEAIHAAGVLHRDLKPSNVFLGGERGVILIDFGIARLWDPEDPATASGELNLTPAYAAPARILLQGADPRDDLYSLGVIAYELLAGANPFAAEIPTDCLNRHLALVPPRPDRDRPEVPSGLATLVMDLLAKERDERPGSASMARSRLASLDGRRPSGSEAGTREAPRPAPTAPAGLPESRPAQVPGSPPRPLPGVVLAAGLLLAAHLVSRLLAPAPGPVPVDPRDPVPAPGTVRDAPSGIDPFGEAYPRTLHRELAEAARLWLDSNGDLVESEAAVSGTTRLLDTDPAAWPRIRAHLPALAKFHEWIGWGGRPEFLEARLRRELLEVEAAYLALGLASPLDPWLHAFPESASRAPTRPEQLVIASARIPVPDRIGGWLAASLACLAEMEEQRRVIEGTAKGQLEIRSPLDDRRLLQVRTLGLRSFLQTTTGDPGVRRQLPSWLEAPNRTAGRLLYMTARSLRDEPATAPWLLVLVDSRYRDLGLWLYSSLAMCEPEVVLGGAATGTPLLLLRARFLDLARVPRGVWTLEYKAAEAEVPRLLARASAMARIDAAGRDLLPWIWHVEVLCHIPHDRPGDLVRLVRDRPRDSSGLAGWAVAEARLRLGKSLLDRAGLPGLDPREILGLAEDLEKDLDPLRPEERERAKALAGELRRVAGGS